MADYLASHVDISEATLHLNNGETSWDPIVFSYGPLQGSASLTLPANCDAPQLCPTRFQLQFGDLDAATFQAAVLGAPEKGTLLSSLVDRLHPSAAPVWPPLEGTVNADSLVLGPVTLRDATADLRILPAGAEIESLDASLLGGSVHGAGALETGDKPVYTLTADFEKLNAVAVGQLLGENWRGGPIHAHAKIQISGYTDKDLIASASGTLHLECGVMVPSAPLQHGPKLFHRRPIVRRTSLALTAGQRTPRSPEAKSRSARMKFCKRAENMPSKPWSLWPSRPKSPLPFQSNRRRKSTNPHPVTMYSWLHPFLPPPLPRSSSAAKAFSSTWTEFWSRRWVRWSAVGPNGPGCVASILN